MPKPSVSRMVHYRSYGTPNGEYLPECRAAVITEVKGDDVVGLAVLNPTGLFLHDAAYSEDAFRGGTWHWPERVQEE